MLFICCFLAPIFHSLFALFFIVVILPPFRSSIGSVTFPTSFGWPPLENHDELLNKRKFGNKFWSIFNYQVCSIWLWTKTICPNLLKILKNIDQTNQNFNMFHILSNGNHKNDILTLNISYPQLKLLHNYCIFCMCSITICMPI